MLWATFAALIVLCLLGFNLQDAGISVHVLMACLGLILLYNLVADGRRALSRTLADSGKKSVDERIASRIDGN